MSIHRVESQPSPFPLPPKMPGVPARLLPLRMLLVLCAAHARPSARLRLAGVLPPRTQPHPPRQLGRGGTPVAGGRMSRRTTAIRFAAMAIESLTATDAGSLQAARDVVDRLSYELAVLAVEEGKPRACSTTALEINRILGGEPGERA